MNELTLRHATAADAEAIAGIYAHYVLEDTATFETSPPDAAEMAGRMEGLAGAFPWLVALAGGRVVAYAYASRLGARQGYDWSAALSVYADEKSRRTGAGRALYTALEELLRLQGIRTVFGGVSVPNPASEAFHTRMGYTLQGVWQHSGYKFGRPLGVAWYAKQLLPPVQNPPPPVHYSALPARQVAAVLAAAVRPAVGQPSSGARPK